MTDYADPSATTGPLSHRDSRRERRRGGFRAAFHRVSALSLVLLPSVTTGCYSVTATSRMPSPGSRVVLDINDQGRVALGPRLGSELARVEGELVRKTDTAYVIRMKQARTLGGITTHWAGETVSLRDEYVKTVGERQLSRSRTLFAAIGFVVVTGLVIVGQSLVGGGGGDTRDGGGGGSDQ